MKALIFSTSTYHYLSEKVLALGGFEKGEQEVSYFSDGERYQRVLSEVVGRKVVVIGGTQDDAAIMELYDLASTLVSLGADSLSLVVPFFGYSTMERAVLSGEVVTAKTRARLLSSIPRSNRGNRIFLFDLHTEGTPHYFEGAMFPKHVYCKSIVIEAARELGGSNFVLASTDAGRAKWVESLANDMGVPAAFILKRRLSGDHTEVSAVNADVDGKKVIIYDDLIRSGGSIINAAKTYKEAGAAEVMVITTHGAFVNGAINKLKNSGIITKLVSTDTHVNTQGIDDDFLEVKSVADLICSELQ